MAEHVSGITPDELAATAGHRYHEYVYVKKALPVQAPFVTDSREPTFARPVIVGAVFVAG